MFLCRRRTLGMATVACCSVVVAAVSPARLAPPAGAAEQNRAVLVVDTGEQVKKVCVRFWEESISGAELLQRADVQAALRPYAGKGVAVCSLCGVGCRTDDSCLTCDPDGRYWAYSRAPAGSPDFRLSAAGASNTQVRNGDVEGWRWSRGASPTYISVAEVCEGAAPATAATATSAATTTATTTATNNPATTAPTATVAPGPNGPPGSVPRSLTGSAPATPMSKPLPSGAPAPSSPTSTAVLTSPEAAAGKVPTSSTAQRAATRDSDDGDEAGSPAGLLAFAGVLVGLLGWAAVARRRRRPT